MKKLFHILSLLLCLTAFGSTAQESPHNFYFRNINKENGLSQTDIKAIAQTPDGFMWFGTRNKLNRYDGRNIKVFDCYDRDKNIRNNNISALHSKEDNSLYVGTDIGVFVLNPKLESFNYIDIAAQDGVRMTNWVSDIQADNDGNTWIILPIQGVFCLTANGTLRHYVFGSADEPDNGTAESLCIDKSGKIWIGTNGNGIFRYNPETDDFKHYLGDSDGNSLIGDNIYCMADIDSDIVIGSHTGKLRCFNKLRNTVTDFNTPQIHNKIIRDVKCFDDRIWVGTQIGVFIIDKNSKVHAHICYDPINSTTLSDNQIGKIFRDHEKGIWIGTNLGGINYLSPFHSNFQRYVPQKGNSIPSKRVRDIAEAPDGQIWLATEDAGISIFNPATGLFDNLDVNNGNLRLYDKKTLTIKRNGDQMWIGYFKNGIDVIDCKTHKVRHYSADDLGINEGSIYALYKDSNNDMWLGNGWSTYKTSGNSMSMTLIPEFGLNYNFDILEDSNHNIWIIT
ncbi:MAG: hybrid sensor histidine kinase/response regulator, partial [Muribaculaceae bacterium]|nr:hybrid sensor histidine kinase/response regulator [Muribaculaceae bacterium]